MTAQLLSVTQAAKTLNVTRATIYKWINQGAIKAKTISPPGRARPTLRINSEEIEKLQKPHGWA